MHMNVNVGKPDNNTLTFIPPYCVIFSRNAIIMILELNTMSK